MVLSVQHHLILIDVKDKNSNIVCKMKSLKFWSPETEIFNSKNKLVYTTDIVVSKAILAALNQPEPRQYVAYCSGDRSRIAASASLEYSRQSRQTLFKLPPADALGIQSIYGDMRIKRIDHKDFAICDGQQRIGCISISPFCKTSTINCDTINDHEFLAVLFTFITYMIHEDDLYVV